MHLWNISALADELRSEKLSEAQAFRYFFIFMVLSNLAFFYTMLVGVPTPMMSIPFGFLLPVLSVALVVAGLVVCFRAFQRKGGRHFIHRFMCLLLPANIRAFVFCLPLYIVAVIVVRQLPSEDQHDVLVLSNALIVAIMIGVQFIILYRHLSPLSPPATAPKDVAVS